MSKKINSCACERAGVLLSSINVMMCRYAIVRRELLSSIIRESCLSFSGSSEEGLGGRQRWGLWSIYEQGIQRIHVRTFRGWLHFFFFFEFALQVILLPHWPTVPLHLQTLIQGQPTAVEKQQMLLCRLEKRERDFDVRDHICVFMYEKWSSFPNLVTPLTQPCSELITKTCGQIYKIIFSTDSQCVVC